MVENNLLTKIKNKINSLKPKVIINWFFWTVFIVVTVVGIVHVRSLSMENEQGKQQFEQENEAEYDPTSALEDGDTTQQKEEIVYIHVKGEVNNPDLYMLPKNLRVKDAVEAAGGFTETADPDSINLAEKLYDSMEIYVESNNPVKPKTTKTSSKKASSSSGSSMPSTMVNINTASFEQLQTLPGIGPSTAQAIIEYREYKGAFTAKEHIMRVSGIKQSVYQKLQDYITI